MFLPITFEYAIHFMNNIILFIQRERAMSHLPHIINGIRVVADRYKHVYPEDLKDAVCELHYLFRYRKSIYL